MLEFFEFIIKGMLFIPFAFAEELMESTMYQVFFTELLLFGYLFLITICIIFKMDCFILIWYLHFTNCHKYGN